MKEVYYTYNNEALSSCIFLSVLSKTDKLEMGIAPLILPLLLDDRSVNYINNVEDSEISLNILIEQQPRLFTSFNQRFLSLLPVMINSLMILKQSGQIEIGTHIEARNSILLKDDNLGERYTKIEKAIPAVLYMFSLLSISELYSLLKIQL
ncbi:hypothetical protein BXY85_1627 [Roseivirga pacifica]|uniref:Uncharacterized protein n=1 Tax=Roseivirga pacifica TaxID=1267423 RepID=A0A1I0MQ72_9BACT|nr:three component ABC system middle component [Roseivirga pacifica]RKQ50611.1 hypothetical protein BXY85_1627 [Roseivirga pacifica]SEV90775.1 hypothetical protein SAMN05216290_0611 [Roseivirga pacifica]